MPLGYAAFTKIPYDHGSLLELTFKFSAKQEIVFVDPRTGMTIGCRVIALQQTAGERYSTCFEFNEPCSLFEPIRFIPEIEEPDS